MKNKKFDAEPLSRRSWNDPKYGRDDPDYDMMVRGLQTLEINYLVSEGVPDPEQWVREMNTPSIDRPQPEAVHMVKPRGGIGKWLSSRSFRTKSV